jgi:hypothetical protein
MSTIKDMRYRGIDDMPITTFPINRPGFRPPRRPGIRPPRPPRRNTGGFDTDYSFLNLPRAGSGGGRPIPLPGMDPVGYQSQVDRFAPTDLPDVEMLVPQQQPLTVDESFSVLDSARPFEDSASLGANQNERFAELGRFFGEKVNSLQGNIDELINTKSQLTKDLEAAFLQQDEMSQQAIEQQLTALEQQEQALRAELETAVAEAEARGIDAVAAAEAAAAEKYGTQITGLENTIGDLQTEIDTITGARDTAVTERDEAIANQDVIRAEAADAQVQALENQKTTLETQYNQTIGDLQGQIDALNTSQVVAETPVTDDLPAAESVAVTPESIIQYLGEVGPFAEGMDANGDGTVDNLDAIYLQQIAEGLRNPDGTPVTAPVTETLPADIAVNENVDDLGFEPPEPELRTNGDEPPLGQNKPPIYYTPEDPAPEVAPSPLISPLGTVDMSKINLPENYMDAIKNIQPPQNFNFNNLGIGMSQGGEASRIQLLLNRLRR